MLHYYDIPFPQGAIVFVVCVCVYANVSINHDSVQFNVKPTYAAMHVDMFV